MPAKPVPQIRPLPKSTAGAGGARGGVFYNCRFFIGARDYLGGDPELARETLQMRALQGHLASESPTHPSRVFGEDVEAVAKRRRLEEERERNSRWVSQRIELEEQWRKFTRELAYAHEVIPG